MKDRYSQIVETLIHDRKIKRRAKKIIALLAVFVLLFTTDSLKMLATTLEWNKPEDVSSPEFMVTAEEPESPGTDGDAGDVVAQSEGADEPGDSGASDEAAADGASADPAVEELAVMADDAAEDAGESEDADEEIAADFELENAEDAAEDMQDVDLGEVIDLDGEANSEPESAVEAQASEDLTCVVYLGKNMIVRISGAEGVTMPADTTAIAQWVQDAARMASFRSVVCREIGISEAPETLHFAFLTASLLNHGSFTQASGDVFVEVDLREPLRVGDTRSVQMFAISGGAARAIPGSDYGVTLNGEFVTSFWYCVGHVGDVALVWETPAEQPTEVEPVGADDTASAQAETVEETENTQVETVEETENTQVENVEETENTQNETVEETQGEEAGETETANTEETKSDEADETESDETKSDETESDEADETESDETETEETETDEADETASDETETEETESDESDVTESNETETEETESDETESDETETDESDVTESDETESDETEGNEADESESDETESDETEGNESEETNETETDEADETESDETETDETESDETEDEDSEEDEESEDEEAGGETEEAPATAEITLDFSGYDSTAAIEDTTFQYDASDLNVKVSVDALETAGTSAVEVTSENTEAVDVSSMEVASTTGDVAVVDGELVIAGDGTVELRNEADESLVINVTGVDSMTESSVTDADNTVKIDVVEGDVPLGAEASFDVHGEEKTAELVDQHIAELEPAEENRGYAAADVSIVRDNETVNAEGRYVVTLSKASLNLPAGAKLDKLYHIHNGVTYVIDTFTETEDSLIFELDGFSDIVLSYTVEYETETESENEETETALNVNIDFGDAEQNGVDFGKTALFSAADGGVCVRIAELEAGFDSQDAEPVQDDALQVVYTAADDAEADGSVNGSWAAYEVASADPGLSVADGELRIAANGAVTLSNGTSTIIITVTNYTETVAKVLGDGATIDVLEGEVPMGASASYEDLSDRADALAEQYGLIPDEAADETAGTAVGFTAFDVGIQTPSGDLAAEGSFSVTVPHAVDVELLEGADVERISYELFHIHEVDGEMVAEKVEDFTVLADELSFVTDGFSEYVVRYTVEFARVDGKAVVSLDFTGFDASLPASDGAILYDTTECDVHVALSQLGDILRGEADANCGIGVESNLESGLDFDVASAELVEATENIRLADGEIAIAGDGSIELTDGASSLLIRVSGVAALSKQLLETEGACVEIVDGKVPLGTEASYEVHSEEETAALVDAYLDAEEGEAAGYSAADLKLVRNEKELNVGGLYRVTIDKDSLIPAGMKLEKLFHIHDGELEELEAQETEEGLVFEMTGFSDIVASYTVDFEYNGYTWSWPGLGSYAIADILSEIGIAGDITGVDLLRVVDCGGDENVLYLSEDSSALISEGAFDDTFRLTVTLEQTLAPAEGEEEPRTEEKVCVITITDDNEGTGTSETFTSTIKFFAQDATIVPESGSTAMHIQGTQKAPSSNGTLDLNKNYYLLATLYDNDNNKLGWKLEPVTFNVTNDTYTVNFNDFYRFEDNLLPSDEHYGTTINTNMIAYTSTQNKVVTRLYRFEYLLSGNDLCYHTAVTRGNDTPEEGYEFGGNFINSQGVNEIHLKKAPSTKKYYVRVRFDEEASTAFESGDRYYVNVKVTHANSIDSFQGAQLITNPSNLPTDPATGLRYYDFEFTQWKNGAGTQEIGTFTGYEHSILVELIHQTQNAYKPNYDPNDASPLPEGTLAKAYRVHYDTRDNNRKNTPTGFYEDRGTNYVYCYDYIDLITINATSDYDYTTILGPNIGYGIVAEHLFQGNDLQTNFAVKHYSAHGHYVSPDLSGQSSGAIVIGQFNVVDGMATNGTGAVAYDDTWGRLPIGHVIDNTLIVYADENTGYNAPDGNVSNIDNKSVVVVHADGAYLSSTMVQPGINYGIAMSNALMSQPDTFTPPITSNTQGTLDTLSFPDGATIYVDGDLFANLLNTTSGLTIKKKENQTIVFNFDTTRDLTIKQFKVHQYKADGTFDYELTTTTDTTHGTDTNNKMDEISRHLVWNLNGVKGKTTIDTSGGIFLQPNSNSEIDIAGTSGGWIVSNGFVYNSSAEWHNFYTEMPDTNKLNLRATKTVDGKIPREGQKFDFFLKEYDPTNADADSDGWVTKDIKQNRGASVIFAKLYDLPEGWHVFKIHENTTVPSTTAGKYIIDQADFYALVKVTKTVDPSGGDRYIITSPVYYKGPFDKTKFSTATGAQAGAFGEKVAAASFDNEAVKDGLTLEKKVVGTTDTTKRFTFEVMLTPPEGQTLESSYSYTIDGIAGTKTLELTPVEEGTTSSKKGVIVLRNGQKATITGLPVGTTYIITETKVGDKAIVAANQDTKGYVDGYQTPASAKTGTIDQGNIAIARFTNTYHAAGSVPLKAKKVMHNASNGDAEMELQDRQFQFTLTSLNSATPVSETVHNDEHGNVTFTTLNFTEADMTGAVVMPDGTRVKTLIYFVTEADGTLENFNYGNVTYDNDKIVIITLTDDGMGHITAKSNWDNFTVGIDNTYEYKAPATLEGTKQLTGREMNEGEFTFTARLYKFEKTEIVNDQPETTTENYDTREVLYKDQNDKTGYANPAYVTEAHGTPTKLIGKNEAAADNGANPPVSTGTITFPTVYYVDAGTYYYQITENTGAGDLPMSVTANNPSAVYYAKVTVPAASGDTEERPTTVEYFSDAACTTAAKIEAKDVLFENTQENINFNVTKIWTDASGNVKGAGYSIVFSVKQNGRAYPITAKHLEVDPADEDRVTILSDGTVRLTGSASGWPVVKIKNVPKATYVVTETVKTPASGDEGTYTISYTVGSRTTTNHATVTENDSTVTIYNTQGEDKYTSITVEKKWVAGETEYTPQSGSVTFTLTKKENKQVAVPEGSQIGVAFNANNITKTGTVHVGNMLLVSFEISFNSVDQKKGFYRNYSVHNINEIIYGTESTNFNGDLAGGRQTVYLPQPCPLSSDEIDAINNSESVEVTFKVPTKGTINGKTIDSEHLGGIKICGCRFDNAGSVAFDSFSEEPTYNTETTITTSTFTVYAEHNWRKVLTGLPLSKSSPVTSYTYTVEETEVNGTAIADTPFIVTYGGTNEDIIGGTVVATNTRTEEEKGALKLTKAFNLGINADSTAATDGTYLFAVAKADAPTQVIKYIQVVKETTDGTPAITYKVADANTEAAWLAAIPQTEGYALVTDLDPGEYTVTEDDPAPLVVSAITNGAGTSGDTSTRTVTLTVVAGDTTAEEASAQVTFTNTLYQANVKIVKIRKDDSGTETRLSGAHFSLTKQGGGVVNGYGDIVVGTDGYTITGLTPGTYTLTETQPPAGYVITVKPITFTVNADGSVTYNDATEGSDNKVNKDAGLVTYTQASGEAPAEIKIGNVPGHAMPNTGGPGTGAVYGAGAALVLLAILGFVLLNRKARRGAGI